MAQSLYTLPNITFVAGRHYVHDGVTYEPGDVVPNANEFRNVESMVRSRHLIPVVKNHNDVPVYYQKDVKPAALVEEKFRFTIKWPEDEDPEDFAPEEHTIPEVLEFVEEHPDLTDVVLEAEEQGKDRVTLEAQLEEKLDELTAFDPAEHTVPDVVAYVEAHPNELERVLASERDNKNRSTLTTQLEALEPTEENDDE